MRETNLNRLHTDGFKLQDILEKTQNDRDSKKQNKTKKPVQREIERK